MKLEMKRLLKILMDYQRLFITDHGGGLPVVYSSGDSVQLPPVMMKKYDDIVGKVVTSDFIGNIAIADYTSPIDEDDSRCNVVVMDQDTMQNNLQFLHVLNNDTNECVTENDARCLQGAIIYCQKRNNIGSPIQYIFVDISGYYRLGAIKIFLSL